MDNEIWKDVLNYEGLYQVSNLGRIKSVRNQIIRKIYKTPKGYLKMTLSNNKKIKCFFIHRLVAFAFIQNSESKPFINHINGIKTDNRVENLEWCTVLENQAHATANNLYKTIINRKQALEIKIILQTKKRTVISIAKEFGITSGVVYSIKQNKAWKSV